MQKPTSFTINIMITFTTDVLRSAFYIAYQARRSLSCFIEPLLSCERPARIRPLYLGSQCVRYLKLPHRGTQMVQGSWTSQATIGRAHDSWRRVTIPTCLEPIRMRVSSNDSMLLEIFVELSITYQTSYPIKIRLHVGRYSP